MRAVDRRATPPAMLLAFCLPAFPLRFLPSPALFTQPSPQLNHLAHPFLLPQAVVLRPRGLGRAMAAGGASFAKHTMLAAVRPTRQVAAACLAGVDLV